MAHVLYLDACHHVCDNIVDLNVGCRAAFRQLHHPCRKHLHFQFKQTEPRGVCLARRAEHGTILRQLFGGRVMSVCIAVYVESIGCVCMYSRG